MYRDVYMFLECRDSYEVASQACGYRKVVTLMIKLGDFPSRLIDRTELNLNIQATAFSVFLGLSDNLVPGNGYAYTHP